MRRFAIAALAVLGLAGTAAAEVNVGVTAAVNPQATGALGGNVRTIALGDSIIFNERIQTSGEGLVQILLADGTTFMVGPNSDLTIDSFVYNPGAGTAEVTASFTKGVLRFIGGQTSKTDNGVTLNTPVGTMGIRGAMVDVVLDPPPGTPPHIDMLFGNEVTLADGQQLLGRLYAAGYSLVLGQNGAFEVMKTPPGWGSQIQAALSGQPGTSGGAGKGPGDGDVSRSEVAQNNKPANPPAAPLNERETRQLLEAVAAYDQLRNFILNNQMSQGFVGGVVYTAFPWSYDNEYDPESETEYGIDYDRNPFANLVDFFTGEVQPTTVAFGPDGVPLSIRMPLAILSYSCGAECVTYGYYLGTDGSGEVAFEVDGSPIRYVATSAYLKDYTTYLDPQEVADLELDCQTCSQFMRWGFWGFSLEDIPRNGLSGELGDIDIEAMWVTGNLTTSAQLQNLASQSESNINAHFRGDAVGIVNNVNVSLAVGPSPSIWKR